MKLLLLADPNSSHTLKWARSLASNDIKILIVGLGSMKSDIYKDIPNIRVKTMGQAVSRREEVLTKLRYLGVLRRLKRIIEEFRPDIMHAHYASSYGLVGALTGFHPFVLSVWGTDVFSFPNKSIIHRLVLKNNLRRADRLLSTSHVMALETAKYTLKHIDVTPFGIDPAVFRPFASKHELFADQDIVVGTVKALEEKYGIEYLIRAFDVVRRRHSEMPLKLLIVGGGAEEARLKQLVHDLGLNENTVFAGFVPYDDVPRYQNMLSVSVSVSVVQESFGVAVIEASACEKPVIVSNMGGLPEVVEDGVTGMVVPPRDVEATASAIERLVLDRELQKTMGKAGRARIRRLYDWNQNVHQMISIYRNLLGLDPEHIADVGIASMTGT